MVLLVEGADSPQRAKTAINLIRYCPDEVVAVLDPPNQGLTTLETLGIESRFPIISNLSESEGADSVVVGVAPSGGLVPETMRPAIREAILKGWTVYSGMHQFLSDDTEFAALVASNPGKIIDLRKNTHRTVATGEALSEDQLRILTVGQDCSVGKMVVSLEVARELQRRGSDAAFLATGQTGILIAGDGIPMDAVVGDFLNGAAEALARRYSDNSILMVEGQGSIFHPRYSPVTLGLMHGVQPHGLIYCMEAGREFFGGMDVRIPEIGLQIDTYETLTRPGKHTPVIGVAINTRKLDEQAAREVVRELEQQLKLPVTDVIRFGTEPLLKAVSSMKRNG